MKILILGPQGSGKGTQAELLAKNFGFLHFEMGKILRSIKDKTVQEHLNSGNPVPDELVRLIAWDFVSRHNKENIVFEGYPRSIAQYEHLSDMLCKFGQKIDYVIDIEIPTEETVLRLNKRNREDDKPEAIKRRLEVYHTQTEPVLSRAQKDTKIIKIDGMMKIVDIHSKIVETLKLK